MCDYLQIKKVIIYISDYRLLIKEWGFLGLICVVITSKVASFEDWLADSCLGQVYQFLIVVLTMLVSHN